MSAGPQGSPTAVDQSWQSYRYLADNAIDVVLEADLTTQIRWISPSIEDVLGWAPADVVGWSAADLVHPEDMPEIGALVQSLNDRGRVQAARVRILRPDGTWKGLQLRGRPALDADGTVVGHIITMQDTSERDEALRALAVLSEGNRVLARVDDEDGLLEQMCEAIVQAGQYPLAWYGHRVDDDARSVQPRARAGSASAYVDAIEVTWGDDPMGVGPTGTALRTGSTQVRHDYLDPTFAPWVEAATAAGLRSSISLPVTVDGEIDGVLVVAAAEAQAFDARSQELLETLASDLGMGLHRLRSVVTLEEQRTRLQGVFASQLDPFLLAEAVRDPDGTIVDVVYREVSTAALEFWGLPRDAVVGHRMSEVFPEEVTNGTLAAYAGTVETGDPLVYDGVRVEARRTGRSGYFDVRGVRTGDGVSVTFRDVTERFEAAQRLAASEERYRILAEHASDVVWQAEPDVGITWSSDSITPVLGWSPDEVVGRSIDLVHPADAEAALLNLKGLARGLVVDGEARVACKGGAWKWVAYTASRAVIGDRVVDIASLHDIDDEVRARQALDFALGHDPLTGMAARPAMLQRLSEVLLAQRDRRLVAVLCIAVDRLASVNEAYTHAVGDAVLTALATRIAETTGTPDLIGRGTGVEFLVVLPDLTSADEAGRLAQRLLLESKRPVVFGDVVVEPTVSIGIAIGDRTSDPEYMTRAASAAMGQAKADGRDRFAFADAAIAEQARHRLDVERRIREALEEDRLVAHFQPVVDLPTGAVTGFECLARVRRVDGTIAPPAHFIPVAELSSLISDIDLAMLRLGLAALARLPEPLTVAVNLSTVTLTRPGYIQLVEQAIREAEARLPRLHLEVTETALLGDTREIVTTMQAIAALGPRWYVDDFGTGYSSISHLRDLPIAGLKLDVSFSAGIRDGDEKSIRLAQALAGLAGGLGLDTVAEGIETPDEATLLRAQGWRHGQGWLYGRPEPLA